MIVCGHGNQVLRWLAFASCERLAHIAGIAPGTFVPQAVLNQEGVALDVDTVIKELFADGDTVSVRFGPGPEAFTVPWDGRSPDPPFRWGADGEIATESELDWLERDLDLYAFGVDDLVNESLAASTPEARADDVAATHATLVSHGGVLQALFTLYESKGRGRADASLRSGAVSPVHARLQGDDGGAAVHQGGVLGRVLQRGDGAES